MSESNAIIQPAAPRNLSDINTIRRNKRALGLAGFLVLSGCVCVFSLAVGAVAIPPSQVVAALGHQLQLSLPWDVEPRHQAIIVSIRLPRVLLGALIGGGLAISGAAMQGLFRNPLADPGLIGVSSGAAVAAVAVIVLGSTALDFATLALGPFALSLAAFGGGFTWGSMLVQI